MESLLDICFPSVLTKDVLDECDKFTCGDDDMDEFFYKDAHDYARFRMGKSYCFRLTANPSVIVACFTVSNDSIRIFDLGSSKKNRMWKEISNREKRLSRYPGILIGRLAVSTNFSGCGYGSEVLRFVKEWFVDDANKSGCRLAIVDAKNSQNVLGFYLKNGFKFLFQSEIDEYAYMHHHEIAKDNIVNLNTRLMYCDLLTESL
ncbi:MAG: GNAT family N-acetyltransferase [Prevotella sp.]|nr:GNAT family N-acetyltransferase [Prevotella sp.]